MENHGLIFGALFHSLFLDACCRKAKEQPIQWFELYFFCCCNSVIFFLSSVMTARCDYVKRTWFRRRLTFKRARSYYPREFGQCSWYPVWVTLSLIPRCSDSPLKLVSGWPFLLPQRDHSGIILSSPQLSIGTYHACLSGGSCLTVCNKRLK